MKDCFNYRRVMRLTSNVRNAAFSVLNILPAPYIYMCVCVYNTYAASGIKVSSNTISKILAKNSLEDIA